MLSEVLVLSEDDHRCAALARSLRAYGYQTRTCRDTDDLCRQHERYGNRLVLLSVTPGHVYIAAARLRAADSLVGIVVAANFRGHEGRVRAMRCGADVCLPRDTQLEEVAAALCAVGRRVGVAALPGIPAEDSDEARPAPAPPEAAAAGGRWKLLSQGWVLVDPQGLRLSLTTSERDLMLLLLREPGSKVPREALMRACAGATAPGHSTGRALDVMISRLRSKARGQGITLPLRSVFRQGYMFAGEL